MASHIGKRFEAERAKAGLEDWLQHRNAKTFPFNEVMNEYHSVGKHFVDADVLARLAEVRSHIATVPGPWQDVQTLASFLDTALDKHDDRYDYPTYLALNVLQLPAHDDPVEHAPFARARFDRLRAQLVCDLLDYELTVLDGLTTSLPQLRPSDDVVEKRIHLAVRLMRPFFTRLGLDGSLTATDTLEVARQMVETVRDDMSDSEKRTLDLSILPVYTAHDEYLFLRVLQSFETTFALIALQLRGTLNALAHRDAGQAAHYLSDSAAALREAGLLFSMLATMQVESFRVFRNYTEGASAIQSRNYKILESLCRTPDADRIDSLAYYSVPEVRERILAGNHTLDDAFVDACSSGQLDADEIGAVHAGMGAMSDALLRWRKTHLSLAIRMLGEQTGTGSTEGTPYLAHVRDIPVFETAEQAVPRTCPFAKKTAVQHNSPIAMSA
ncbi:MAG: tryptophan 2,3-dioxygenase [Nocardiaceae bacterium]|nr:tryptophan 2,3-dioxygenase [Nocardiaceae bacterium]